MSLVRRGLRRVGATICRITAPKHSVAATLVKLPSITFSMRPAPGAGTCSDHLILLCRRRNVHVWTCLIVLIAPLVPLVTCLVLTSAVLDTRTYMRCECAGNA